MPKLLDHIWPESREILDVQGKFANPVMTGAVMAALVEDKHAHQRIINPKTPVAELCRIAKHEEEMIRYLLAAMRGKRFKKAIAILKNDSHVRIKKMASMDI